MIQFPERAYFQMSNAGNFGMVIRELSVCDAGDIEKAAQAVDDDTASVFLIEDGLVTDASEDVAAKWFSLNEKTIQFTYGEPLVPDFIKRFAPDQLADLEGEIAVAALNNHHHNEHHFARAS